MALVLDPPQHGQRPLALLYEAIRLPATAMILLSLLLVGADLIHITFGGFTFKLAILPLSGMLFFQILQQRGRIYFNHRLIILSALLAAAAVLSLLGSVAPAWTVGYIAWLLFTFAVIVPGFYTFARSRPAEEVVRIWIWAYRVQAVLLILELGVRHVMFPAGSLSELRPHLAFYEPSYASIYFSGYIGAAFYLAANGMRWARRDVALSILVAMALFSATAIFAVVFGIAMTIVLARHRWRALGVALLGLSAGGCILYFYLRSSVYYELTVGYLFTGSGGTETLLLNVLARGGNRIVRTLFAVDAFLRHPVFGIGFGADKAYTATQPVPALAQPFMYPWFKIKGTPFCNPFAEAAGTMGVPGLVALIVLTVDTVLSYFRIRFDGRRGTVFVKTLFVGFLVMFLTMQLEGTFLRFYLWSGFGLAYGAAARWQAGRAETFVRLRGTPRLIEEGT